MSELPEEEIETAEDRTADHRHGGVDDATLLEHLRSTHGLQAPAHLSGSTLQGLHDRLHEESGATDQ